MHEVNVNNEHFDEIRKHIVGILWKYQDYNIKLEHHYQNRINELIVQKNCIINRMQKCCEDEIKNLINIGKEINIDNKYFVNEKGFAILKVNNELLSMYGNIVTGNGSDDSIKIDGIIENIGDGNSNVNDNTVDSECIRFVSESNNDNSYHNGNLNRNINGKYDGVVNNFKHNKLIKKELNNDDIDAIVKAKNVEMEEKIGKKIDSMVKSLNNGSDNDNSMVNDGYKWQCNDCSKKFKTKREVRMHIAAKHIKDEDKPFKCNECNKAFAMVCLFNLHKVVHTSKYECKICKSTWRNAYSLKIHERLHTGEKPFVCQFCKKRFAWKTSWKRHELTHQGVQTWKCE